MAASTVTIKDANGVDVTIATELNAGVHTFRHTLVAADGSLMEDEISESLTTIDYSHHEIHKGGAFILDVADTSMANGDYIGIGFTTPVAATGIVHIIAGFASKGSVHLEILCAPTLTGGTAATPRNRNNGSVNTSGLSAVKTYDSSAGDTITGGTMLHKLHAFTAISIGADNRDTEEFLLAPSTVCAIKLTSDDAANAGQIIINWYEHISS